MRCCLFVCLVIFIVGFMVVLFVLVEMVLLWIVLMNLVDFILYVMDGTVWVIVVVGDTVVVGGDFIIVVNAR